MGLKKGKRPVSGKDMLRRRVDEYVSPEKLMASNFSAMHLGIRCIAGNMTVHLYVWVFQTPLIKQYDRTPIDFVEYFLNTSNAFAFLK